MTARSSFILACVLLAARLSGRDLDPLEALELGRVRAQSSIASGAPGGGPPLRVASPGRSAAAVRADGTFSLEGIAVGAAVRAELLPGSGGAPWSSPPLVLEAQNGFRALASIAAPGFPSSAAAGPPPLFSLDLTDEEGVRRVLLPVVGWSARVIANARDRSGRPYDEPLSNPALRLSSADPRIAAVTAGGVVAAEAPGVTWVRAAGDGEWSQVLVIVDPRHDSDGDGMPDSWEVEHGLDPHRNDADLDLDGDGLTNLEEYRYGTRPDRADSDGDGLSDRDEILVHGTDPLNPDSDGDFITDGFEVMDRSDPLNPNDRPGSAFTPVHRVTRPFNFWQGTRIAARADDHFFVLASDGNLLSYRFEVPTYFTFRLNELLLSGSLRDIAVDGPAGYVAAGADGLHVIDLSNPSALRRIVTISGLGEVNRIAIQRGFVYLATSTGLRIYRAGAAGAAPTAVGSLLLPALSQVAVNGSLAFAGIPSANQLVSIDVSRPAQPRELQRFTLPASARPFGGMAAALGAVYIAHGPAGLLVVGTANPQDLRIIDSSLDDLPGAAFDGLRILGNRIAALTPVTPSRAQLFRLLESGELERAGDAPFGISSILDFALVQEQLISINSGNYSISSVLPAGDRESSPPRGRLSLLRGGSVVAHGATVTFNAVARDDVYTESVDFFVDGEHRARDRAPPFRLTLRLDAARPLPYEVAVSATAADLRGNEGPIGSMTITVERDLDGDGIPDSLDPDRDGDGIPDIEELYPGADGFISDPELVDTDGDGIPDGEEVVPGADGYVTDPSNPDTDGDGLTDLEEILITRTDPTRADTDGNGILDGDEDPDRDGLTHRQEILHGTDPFNPDTDGDGLPDGLEVELGLDPTRADTDGNGIPDGLEDTDGDGLTNLQELALGTHPGRADTDGDGLDDPVEIQIGTDPVVATDFSALDLRFQGLTVVARRPLAFRSLHLERSTLAAPVLADGSPASIELEVAGRLSIDAESRISADARGYAGGRGPGNPGNLGLGPAGVMPPGERAGGGHGGSGGRGGPAAAAPGQDSYGDFRRPLLGGGGGSGSASGARGGRGGGRISIRAGTIELEGTIRAAGEGAPAVSGGGGGGGAVLVSAGRLSGSGVIQANGGPAASGSGSGAGGGGRISLRVADLSAFDLGRLQARGGGLLPEAPGAERAGGAGTIYLAAEEGPGELRLDNAGRVQDEPRTPLAGIGEGTILELGDDYIVSSGPPFLDDVVGLELVPDASSDEARTFTVVAQEGSRLRTEPGLLAHTRPGATYRGVLRFRRLSLSGRAALWTRDRLVLEDGAESLALSSGELHAAELAFDGTQQVILTDAVLAVDRLRPASGAVGEIRLTRSVLWSLAQVDAGVITAQSSSLIAAPVISAARIFLEASIMSVPDPEHGSYWPLVLEASETLSIDAASAIDLTGKGFTGGFRDGNPSAAGERPAGLPAGANGSGGSHGGRGGQALGGGAAADGHDAPNAPALPGGGGCGVLAGGVQAPGGNGGGVLFLQAGTLLLQGRIEVSGAGAARPELFDDSRSGAGGGGAISMVVSSLSGSGSVLADGGAAKGSSAGGHGGAGGGGRVALVAAERSGFTGILRAAGGSVLPGPADASARGGPGTLFFRLPSESEGELTVDGAGVAPRAYRTIAGGPDGEPLRLKRLVIRGGAYLESRRELEVALLDAGAPTRLTIDGALRAPRLVLPEVNLIEVRAGELDVVAVRAAGAGVRGWVFRGARCILREPLAAVNLSLINGGALTVPEPTLSTFWPAEVDISGTFLIDSTSAVDLAGKGYVGGGQGGNTDQRGQTADGLIHPSGGRTGGSHGGVGGYHSNTAGHGLQVAPAFDDYLRPRRPGGGGSGKLDEAEGGYNGGGLLHARAASLVLHGRIDVQGDGKQRSGSPRASGAGAGGGVWLEVGTISGLGEIDADGGSADSVAGGSGAGGGGRVAIYYQDRGSFLGRVHALGGTLIPSINKSTSVGGAGTVFFKGPAQAYGDLFIDNGGRVQSVPRTQLRPVGSGSIQALGPQSLRGNTVFPLSDTRLEGQWVVVDNRTLIPFRILTNSRDELTTDPQSGDLTTAAAPGRPFQGALVLDNLAITGSAAFTTQGDLIIIATGDVQLTSGGTLNAPPVVKW
jgi:hypothetical protein